MGTIVCSFCGKNGHTDTVCFKKKWVSYKTGHTVDVCYRKHGYPPGHEFDNGKSLLSRSQEPTNDTPGDNFDPEVRLTKQQYHALMALINPTADNASNPQIGSMIFSSQDPDSITHHKIGLVDLHARLYVLHGLAITVAPCVHSVSSQQSLLAVNNNIWHNRLGHLSDKRLEVLKQKYPCINYRSDNCNACHIVKQKKLPFTSHNSVALHVFLSYTYRYLGSLFQCIHPFS
ncbi:uncharacterized protein LOC108340554 [Vigna angularis]|nr:uncharacterized protein LOC108340554 [Vigna angularis]